MSIVQNLSEPVKHAIDTGAVLGTAATLLGILPTVTAILIALWAAMRIYEMWLSIQLKRQEKLINDARLRGLQ